MDNKVANKGMKKFLLINCHACDLMQVNVHKIKVLALKDMLKDSFK